MTLQKLIIPKKTKPTISGGTTNLQNSLKVGRANTDTDRSVQLDTKRPATTLNLRGKPPIRWPLKVNEHTSFGHPGIGNLVASLHRSRCSVCCHKDANAIAIEIFSGASYRSIAEHRGLSKSALIRHAAHIPENLIQARLSGEIADRDLLLAEIVGLKSKLTAMFDEAAQTKSRGAATQLSGALLRTFELLRKMVVNNDGHPQPNRRDSDNTAALIGKIFQALKDYPDARVNLAEAISPSAKPSDMNRSAGSGKREGASRDDGQVET